MACCGFPVGDRSFLSRAGRALGRRDEARPFEGCEALEPRLVLAAVSWTGLAGDSLWHTPGNWSNNAVPTVADDVTIDVAASPTIQFTAASGSRSVNSLVLREALSVTGGTLSVAAAATIDAAGSVTMAGGTLSGGAWNATAGALRASSGGGTLSSVAITGDVLLDGANSIVRLAGSTSFAAARLTGANSILQMAPGYILTTQVVAEGATAGARTIQLGAGGAGTVTFAPGSQLRLAAGAGGNLSIQQSSVATLVNSGTVLAEAAGRTLIIQPNIFTNNGAVQLTAGTVNLQANTWSNPGSISAAAGAILNFASDWSSAGSISISGATLNLGGSFSTAGFNFAGLSRTGGTINLTGALNNSASVLGINASTGTWNLQGGDITGGTVNQSGGAILAFTGGGGTLSSVVYNAEIMLDAPNAVVRVAGSTSFVAARLLNGGTSLQLAPGYTLAAPATAEGAAAGTRIIQAGVGGTGTVTIAPGVLVALAAGVGGNLAIQQSSLATLVNNGTILAAAPGRTLTIQPNTFTNSGAVQVSAGTLTLQAGSWTNAGSISGGPGTVLNFLSDWTNPGTLTIDSATLTLGGAFSTAGFNFAGFSRTGGTVNLTGQLNNTGSALNMNAATGTWNLQGGAITGGSVNHAGGAILAFTGGGGSLASVAYNAEVLLDAPNASVRVVGSTSFVAARLLDGGTSLQLAPGYTLAAPVTAEGAAAGTRLLQIGVGGVGTVTFAPGVLVTLAAGAGGNLAIQQSSLATLVNNGTILAAAAGRTLTIQPNVFTNNGAVQVSAGTGTIQAGTWTNAGSISAAPGTVLNLLSDWTNPGTLTIDGATLTLGGAFSTAGFNFAGFTRTGGTVNLTGQLNNTGATLTLNAATGSWNLLGGDITGGTIDPTGGAQLTITSTAGSLASVIYNGELLLSASSAVVRISGSTTFAAARLQGLSATLQLATGYTVNSLVVAEGAAGGSRIISLAVGGAGTVTVGPSGIIRHAAGAGGNLSLQNSSLATLVNNGQIIAGAAGRTLTIQPSAFTNNGLLHAAAGTLSITSATVTNFAAGTLTGGTWSVATGGTLSTAFSNVTTNAAAIVLDGAGVWAASGTILSNSGSLSLLSGRDFAAGGAFTNSGTLTLSPGSILSGPSYTQTGSGTLAATLAGTDPSTQFGRVNVAGAAALDGSLTVTLAAYQPAVFATFDIVTGGSRSGTFTSLNFPAPLLREQYYIVYNGTTARLEYDHALGVWTGAGNGTSWTDAANWARSFIPDASTDAYISVAGTPTVVLGSGAQSIRSLFSDEALSITGGSLSVGQAATLTAPLDLAGGSAVLSGVLSAPAVTVGAGSTLTLNSASSLPGLTLSGTLAGSGDLTVTTSLIWLAGSMSGGGKTIIAPGSILSLAAPGAAALGRTLENRGTVSYTGAGDLELVAAGLVQNIGTFTWSGSGSIVQGAGTGNALLNSGTLGKTGAAAVQVSVPLTNTGTLTVQSGTLTATAAFSSSGAVTVPGGTLALTGGGNQTGAFSISGALTLAGTHTFSAAAGPSGAGSLGIAGGSSTFAGAVSLGGSAAFLGGTAAFNGGFTLGGMNLSPGATVVVGATSASGSVTSAGTLDLGAQTLNVTGSYTQTASGTLKLRMNGPAVGQFGRLNVSGAATLAGTLDITWGYQPSGYVNFNFISAGSRTGTFGTVQIAQPGGPRLLSLVYGPGGVTLQVLAPKVALA